MQRAAVVLSRPDTVLVDLSAAHAWRLPLPPWLQHGTEHVSLAVVPDRAHPRRRGTRGRRLTLPPEHLDLLDGSWITTPARTWLDCAAHLPLAHIVAMGDAALRRGLCTTNELSDLCRWARRRRGVATARAALPLLDANAESPGESLTRVALVTARVPAPLCNADVYHQGAWLARVDMLWPDQRVIVEYDGIVHLSERQRRYDASRRNLLQDAGYLVIVVTARDLKHPEQLVALVSSALRSRQPR